MKRRDEVIACVERRVCEDPRLKNVAPSYLLRYVLGKIDFDLFDSEAGGPSVHLLVANSAIDLYLLLREKEDSVPGPANINAVIGASSQPMRACRTPRIAQFALLLIPKRNRNHLIGDLAEEYCTIVLPEHGPFWAKVWYWEQTAIAIGCYVWPMMKRLLGLTVIWKVMGG